MDYYVILMLLLECGHHVVCIMCDGCDWSKVLLSYLSDT